MENLRTSGGSVNRLFTKSLASGDVGYLITMPNNILTKPEKKWLDFVKEYTTKYNVPPTVERLESEFSDYMPVYTVDPLGDVYIQEVGQRRNTLVREFLIKEQGNLQDGADPYTAILELTERLSVPTTQIVNASDFDISEFTRMAKRHNFGFEYIDEITGGMTEGDLVYLFGRPGSGKTSVLINWIAKWAIQGLNILVISNEIRYNDFMFKILATISGVDQTSKRKGALSNTDLSLLRIAQNLLAVNNNLHVVTHPVTNVSNITSLLAERKVDILCIDGVYLMSPSGKPSSDWKDLAEVSRSLKQIANSNSICVVGVIQGSRVNENGLTSAGVAGTDAFLQDADILFGVQKNSVSPGERLVDFECVKNRSGVPGAVTLTMSYPLFDVWENDGDSKIRS